MKTIKIAIGTLTLVAVCQAAPAFAYLSPDQVFGGAGLTLAPAPPTMREGADVVAAQQQRSATLRSAAQAQLPSLDDEPVDNYVAPTTSTTRSLFDNNTQYEIRQQRIANRNSGTPTIIITGNGGAITDANGTVLHSGAPRVADTGPEHVAMAALALALLASAAYLWRRASAVPAILLR
jgi:hypothetical protein